MNANTLKMSLMTLSFAAAALLSANAQAEDMASANLNVSANVVDNCIISVVDLQFGAYDPIVVNASAQLTGTGVVTVTCTTGAQANLTLGQGQNGVGSNLNYPNRRMTDDGSNYLDYVLYQDGGYSQIWGDGEETCVYEQGHGSASEHYVFGTIPPGQNVPEGTYSDVVLATVQF